MEFEEELEFFNKLEQNVDARLDSLESARNLIIESTRERALEILMEELSRAIEQTPEFQYPVLRDRLFAYFDDIENIIVEGRKVLIHPDADSEDANRRWMEAKWAANAGRGKNPAKSQKQAAAYWKNVVYGGEKYDDTISERLELLEANDAPYWAFLEYGTGAYAWPMSGGTFFLTKARRRSEPIYREEEDRILRAYDDTPIEEDIRYSRSWTTSTGKTWSFVFTAGQAKRVVQVG